MIVEKFPFCHLEYNADSHGRFFRKLLAEKGPLVQQNNQYKTRLTKSCSKPGSSEENESSYMPNLAHNNAESCGDAILYESSESNEICSSRYSFAELEAEHQQMNEPLIDGLARVGETINLIANPKIGKSWMVYDVALSVVTGKDWLGFNTKQGKVLLVDNELHPPTLAQRIQWVAEAMELEGSGWKQDFEVWPLRGNLKSLQELTIDINEACSKGDFKLIILDAKYRFANTEGDENSNTAEAKFYNEIDRVAEMTGAAILLVHHATKGGQSSNA